MSPPLPPPPPRTTTKQANDDDVVIVSALRTPLCRSRKGALAKVPPSTLLETVFRAILDRTGVSGQDVEDICVGNCLLPPSGYAALRMAHIVAGIPYTTSFQTVNRQCSSGLQAVAHIAHAIQSGQINVGIGGGVESMSLTPMYVCLFVCSSGYPV
jgi:acetyl-CoA acyltransferase 1